MSENNYSLSIELNENKQCIIPKETWDILLQIGIELPIDYMARVLANGDVLLTSKK